MPKSDISEMIRSCFYFCFLYLEPAKGGKKKNAAVPEDDGPLATKLDIRVGKVISAEMVNHFYH